MIIGLNSPASAFFSELGIFYSSTIILFCP